MKNLQPALIGPLLTGIASLLLFMWISWPLPRFWSQGIPSSSQNIETPAWRTSIPGDHLQLLYHFDLVDDMFSGRAPFFHNLWEFNTGEDADRYRPGAYFFPMSGVYVLLKQVAGQAAAWNTTLWISVWLSGLFSWYWLRRFTDQPLAIAFGVTLIVMAPFRWASLMGGSPAGIALMWVPLFALQVDRALSRPRFREGALAGALLLMLFWADLQVFYLCALTSPLLVLISLAWKWESRSRLWKQYWKLLPGGILFLLIIGIFYLWRKSHLSSSLMEGGRSWRELALFSPRPGAILRLTPGTGETIYIGWIAFLFLLVASIAFLITAFIRKDRNWSRIAGFGMMLAAVGMGVSLSLGVRGPWGGRLIQEAREWIPYYEMIRQPFKLFAIIPLWLGWILCAGVAGILERVRLSARSHYLIGLLGIGLLVGSYSRHLHTTVSLFESPQSAYQAVAEHAKHSGNIQPHIVVVPLWPGDSAETSIPMHFAQQYQLRMLNGYSPVVSQDYMETVFRKLESINQGRLTRDQLEHLTEMGVTCLIVHANQFPEKVSPFPIRETLARLDAHPRLRRLAQSGPVHAYEILDTPDPEEASIWSSSGGLRFPARRWELEHQPERDGGEILQEASASGGAYVRGKSSEDFRLETRAARIAPFEGNRWRIRLRGTGTLEAGGHTYRIASETWEWVEVPFVPPPDPGDPTRLRLRVEQGQLDLDTALLTGPSDLLNIGENGIRLPASLFFHAGFADPATDAVHFRPGFDPDRIVFYGPLLPVNPGRYIFELHHSSSSPAGTHLGDFRILLSTDEVTPWLPVQSGEPTSTTTVIPDNRPLRVEFRYNRQGPIQIQSVEITPGPHPALRSSNTF
ncbi:MAG: hypothetical protein WD708_03465 [Kiritimatiellia bacterium]